MPVRRSLLFLQFSIGQLAFTGIDRDFVGVRPGQGSLPHRLFPVAVDLKSKYSNGDARPQNETITRGNISWYILRPESQVMSPDQFRENSAFTCGCYRVYDFTREQE